MNIHPIDGPASRVMPDSHAEAHKTSGNPPAQSLGGDEGRDHSAVSAYVSPVIRFDASAGITYLQFRDGDTGEPKYQYPSERVVSEYTQQMRANREVGNIDVDKA